MLRDRLISAAVLISVISGLLFLDANYPLVGVPGLWLLPAIVFFAFGTAWDISRIFKSSGHAIRRVPGIGGAVLVAMSTAIPMAWPLAGSEYPADCPVGVLGWIVLAAVAAIFWVLIVEMKNYGPETKGAIECTLAGIFVSLYVGVPMALLVAIRMLGGDTSTAVSGDISEGVSTANWGLAALLTMIATTKSADTGAYFVGRMFGRRKLIPRLSPGKTREGALGGVVAATIVAFVCLKWLFPWIENGDLSVPSRAPAWGCLVLGPVLGVSGIVGDLAESLVKRDSGVKDSGNLLPGMGGVWDVTDSLIAAVMPAFVCFAAGVAG